MNDTFPTSGRHPERSEGSLYFAFVVACSFVVIPQRRPHRSEGYPVSAFAIACSFVVIPQRSGGIRSCFYPQSFLGAPSPPQNKSQNSVTFFRHKNTAAKTPHPPHKSPQLHHKFTTSKPHKITKPPQITATPPQTKFNPRKTRTQIDSTPLFPSKNPRLPRLY